MSKKVTEFREYRQEMNNRLLAADNKIIKRIFNLDTNTYVDGALTKREKELLGLVASMVLRCDDCVKYHLEQCFELGLSKDQVMEVFAVANLVGGTIVIPHTRRALEYWEELEIME
jgi:AhpD family alkylhydroperoxidase